MIYILLVYKFNVITYWGDYMSTKLVQIKLPVDIKQKLDEIFAKDGTSTPQGLKMVATQIANRGYSPFTSMYYENYTEPVGEETKKVLRQEQLKLMGVLPDDADKYSDIDSLKKALDEKLG